VLVIIQNANSAPQFIGQKVVSRSIANGGLNGIPEISNDLLPPLLPDEVGFLSDPLLKSIPLLSLEVEPPPPPSSFAPAVFTTKTTTTKTTTARPVQTTTARIAPVQRPQTQKFQLQSAFLQSLSNDLKFNGDDGRYKIKGETGSYRPKGNLGYYTHSNQGSYKRDDRGKYRSN
jgi:hypothetical protein